MGLMTKFEQHLSYYQLLMENYYERSQDRRDDSEGYRKAVREQSRDESSEGYGEAAVRTTFHRI